MKSLKPMTAFLLTAALAAAGAMAQTTTTAPTTADAPTMLKDAVEAEIRKFDKDARKITLKHGTIKNLDMPAMTMVFQVNDARLLDKLAQWGVGDKIAFTAEKQQGAYVVTGAEKAQNK